MIYLDNAATSYYKPEAVSQAMVNALNTMGNSGRGVNDASLAASEQIFEVRSLLADFFHAESPSCIAFTANSTESLNIAIKGLFKSGDHVITSVLEHNSVLRPLYEIERQGVEITILDCDETGMISPIVFENAIKDNTKAIITTHASNLTGNIVDISALGQICKKHNIKLIVDASQSAGFLKIDVQAMNIDVLCFTGHKSLMGPQGIGGIYVKPGTVIRPLLSGGSGVQTFLKNHPIEMPVALEAGTLNGPGIAGLGAAINHINQIGLECIREKELKLMWYFYENIRDIPGVTIYGNYKNKLRCPITAINIGKYDSATIGMELSYTYGIAIRSGAHCAPLMHNALGTKDLGAIRFSFSYYNSESDIDTAINAVKELSKL